MTKAEKEKIDWSILTMAAERGGGKSVCPSEIARELFPGDWRDHMQEVRDQAIALHKAGKVRITQNDTPVDPDHIKGPVRLKIVTQNK